MQIRKIKPEENVIANMIDTVAFVLSKDFTEELKDPAAHSEGYENVWAAFTDNNIMMSRLSVIPYTVMFDGNEALMGGIGGVASLPEYRDSRGIRNILIEAMKEMKDKGQVFSYLYPFSHKYYRKFGYEMCFDRRLARFPISICRQRKPEGSLTFFHKNDDIRIYMDIYRRFIDDKNLAVVRTEKSFVEFLNKDAYVTRQYTYLWHNGEGAPKSYLTFEGVPQGFEKKLQMKIKEFAWEDNEGLHGLLSCLGRFDAQYDEVIWEAPDTVDLYSLLAEPYEMSVEIQCGGMNRIVDVKKALELMKAPLGVGAAVISVTDDFLEWNNKSFEILWQNGRLTVNETKKEPDMSVSVQTLVRLVCGYFTPDVAERSINLKINKNRENLNRLFYKKHLFITDRF